MGRITKTVYKDEYGNEGRTLTYTYTEDGQLWSIHDSSTGVTSYYTYDTLGRLLRSTVGGMQTSNTYDSFNRLTARKFWDSVLGNGTETFTYDANTTNYISEGVLTNMQMVNGHTIALRHDTLQRLESRHINSGKDNGNGGMWEGFTYNGTQVRTKGNWKSTASIDKIHEFTYEYDGNGNITKETESLSGKVTTYAYDRLNQLIREDNQKAGKTWTWEYDSAGNITKREEYDYTTGELGDLIDTVIYYYTADENAENAGPNHWKDLLKTVGRQTGLDEEVKFNISYDEIGNPTNYYDGTTMTWAEGRRLQSVTKNGIAIHYQYNADGLRTKKISPDGSYTVYHIADGRYVGETRCYANTVPYLYLRYTYNDAGSVCGFSLWNAGDTAWTEYYFATNLQGDVLQVYTAANDPQTNLPQLVASYTYDAWGNILNEDGALKDINPFRYRGYYYDEESDFYYLQSRYYDPEIGRFLNADSYVSTGQGLAGNNMFAYCGNNPVARKDDFGRRYCAGTTVSSESSEERGISCRWQRYVKLENPTLLDVWEVSGVSFVPNNSGNGGVIVNSYRIVDRYEMAEYATYLMFKSEYREYFSGSIEGFVFEWDVHNIAYQIYNSRGDIVNAAKAKSLDVGRTIYFDDHDFRTYVMLRAYEFLFPVQAQKDLMMHNATIG